MRLWSVEPIAQSIQNLYGRYVYGITAGVSFMSEHNKSEKSGFKSFQLNRISKRYIKPFPSLKLFYDWVFENRIQCYEMSSSVIAVQLKQWIRWLKGKDIHFWGSRSFTTGWLLVATTGVHLIVCHLNGLINCQTIVFFWSFKEFCLWAQFKYCWRRPESDES